VTHNERVLDLLADGEWHDHHELYALHVIAHSRISELRRRGHLIEIRRDGDLYLYRLVSGPTVPQAPALADVRPGEHGSRRSADQPSDGEPNGRPALSPLPPVDSRSPQCRESSPSEHSVSLSPPREAPRPVQVPPVPAAGQLSLMDAA